LALLIYFLINQGHVTQYVVCLFILVNYVNTCWMSMHLSLLFVREHVTEKEVEVIDKW